MIRFESRQYQIEFGCSLKKQPLTGAPPPESDPRAAHLCSVQHNVLFTSQSVRACRRTSDLVPSDCTLSLSALNSTAIESARLERQSKVTADATSEEIQRAELLYGMQLDAATTPILTAIPITGSDLFFSHDSSAEP